MYVFYNSIMFLMLLQIALLEYCANSFTMISYSLEYRKYFGILDFVIATNNCIDFGGSDIPLAAHIVNHKPESKVLIVYILRFGELMVHITPLKGCTLW